MRKQPPYNVRWAPLETRHSLKPQSCFQRDLLFCCQIGLTTLLPACTQHSAQALSSNLAPRSSGDQPAWLHQLLQGPPTHLQSAPGAWRHPTPSHSSFHLTPNVSPHLGVSAYLESPLWSLFQHGTENEVQTLPLPSPTAPPLSQQGSSTGTLSVCPDGPTLTSLQPR